MRLILAAAVLAVGSVRASAQSVPLLTFEGTMGSGQHTMQTQSARYTGDRTSLKRLAATLRLGSPGRLRPVLSAEYTPFYEQIVQDASCAAANWAGPGPCPMQGSFESPDGTALSVGLRAAPWSQLVVTGFSGIGWYQHKAGFAGADVSFQFSAHVAALVDARYIRSNNYWSERTWFLPISYGFRIY